ncbi:transglycosylase SLT domain-containing protein [Bradyrhizobium sp. CSA207]|nr:transglycosylase SLT domain-containing protein [Bradyrhizobium sp. CSA207]
MPDLPSWPVISPCGWSQHRFSVSASFSRIGAHCRRIGRPRGRLGETLYLAAVRTMGCGAAACSLGILLTFGPSSTARAEVSSRAPAAQSTTLLPSLAYAAFVTEASHRFAIPERWINAVMQVESGGNAHAISPSGALGLMQIMPATWVELSARHDLGIDPFDPHDNIMAGAAYLREMLDRFGSGGFLAAYNAGPKRYEQHLTTGRSLPDETQTYVARITPLIGLEQRESAGSAARQVVLWQQAPVFVERRGSSSAADGCASGVRTMTSSKPATRAVASALVPRATGLFMHRSVKEQSP